MPGPLSLNNAEIDLYSIRLCVQSGLAANGWTSTRSVPVKLANNGWPTAEAITPPEVYVAFGENKRAGIALGSHGKERDVNLFIFAHNDPTKIALAEEITNLFRDDQVAPLAFVTGNETSPARVGSYEIDAVGWRPTPMPATATQADKWRATVAVTLRRDDA